MAKYSPEEIARLDARMAELDKYLKDPTMKLGRGASGKFQFRKADEQKKAVSVSPKKTSTATSAATTTKTSTPSRFTSLPGSGPRTGGANISTSLNPDKPAIPRPPGGGAISTTPNYEGREARRNQEAVAAAREANRLASEEFGSARQRMNDILGESASQKRDLALGAATALPIGRGAKYLYDLSRLTRPGKALIKSLENLPEESVNLLDRFRQGAPQFKKGGSVRPGKVKTVMHEFKAGKLKSSSGQKVTNPKQAVAIAMSEAGMKKAKKFGDGGMTDAEAKKMADTELANQESARKMMEEKKKSSETKRYARGGKVGESKEMAKKEISFMKRKGAPKSMIKHEKEEYGMKRGGNIAMKKGGACMKSGGGIDGIAKKGKTKTQHFAKGGSVSARADGCATKGKTNCKMR